MMLIEPFGGRIAFGARVVVACVALSACAAGLSCTPPRGSSPGATGPSSPSTRDGAATAASAIDAVARLTAARSTSEALDPSRVWAVLVNGGSERSANYQSHLIHVRAMLAWVEAAGIPRDHVVVFSSDGDDPAADLATRELRAGRDAQLLDGTRLEGRLGRPIEYVSTEIEGIPLRPATREALRSWFDTDARAIPAGDTLLFYVTDHGTKGKTGPEDTRISLWNRESIDVRELDEVLARVDPGVRIVTLMSQCYSGGFARLGRIAEGETEPLPSGRVCGYFSSTEKRPAYGCYPENRGKNNIGHSVRFIEALDVSGDFGASHEWTLVRDRTPDVPLRTSDVQLELFLEAAAKRNGVTLEALADELLAEAWRDRATWEPDIRLLDRIGQSFGVASPRSVAEIDERLADLPRAADPLGRYAGAWKESLGDLSQANLERFLAANPAWVERISDPATKGLEAQGLRDLGDALIADLGPFTRADEKTDRRLVVLRERSTAAGGASYRMEVREAALLRMRAVLLSIAGRTYLASRATPSERQALEALIACENVTLAMPPADVAVLAREAEPDLPPFAEDVRIARESAPAWMGISFQPVPPEQRSSRNLPPGAVTVREVMPNSPAERAGLEIGDVILGPPDKHFEEPRQVREWTMLRAVGEPAPLAVLRDTELTTRSLVPDVHPGKFPDLPGPPQVGSVAPKVELEPYRGEVPGALALASAGSTPAPEASGQKQHLLFFWATWCGPCKAAVPEVVAFARERDVEVIAITDEEKSVLDEFFPRWKKDFPATVARDTRRRTNRAFGVSGTPTFVLIDEQGIVQSYSTGYSSKKGIGVPGWSWSGAQAKP